jgi:hypothetical protein
VRGCIGVRQPRARAQLSRGRRSTTPEPPTLSPRSRETGLNPLLNTRALKLCDRAEDTSYQATGGRTGVDSLAERNERHAARLPFVEQQDQMAQIASETIKTPARHGPHFMAANIGR